MANTKISALPAAATVGNTDLVPLVQDGATKAATVVQLLASVLGANPPAALDTLKELADAIGDDPNYATNLVTTLAGKTPAMTATGVKTAAYTAGVNEIVPADATAGAVPIALPTGPADRTRVTVKKIDTSTNTVTVTTGGTDVLNKAGGSTAATLALPNQSTTVQYTAGTGVWYVVAADTPLSQLDARYPTTLGKSNGTDDTAWLNAALATGGSFRVTPGTTYLLGGPLVLVSNTDLDTTGGTFTGKTGWTGSNMLTNRAATTPNRTVTDTVLTAASTTITSATAVFTAADVGRTVLLNQGNPGANAVFTAKIASITDAATAVLTIATPSAATGATLKIYDRDVNIRVRGSGLFNRGNVASASNDISQHSLLFRRVDHLTVDPAVRYTSTNGKYAVSIADVNDFNVQIDVSGGANSDGVHLMGPAARGVLGAKGTTHDDFIAIGGGDYSTYCDVQGDITDIEVLPLKPTSSTRHLHIFGASTGRPGIIQRVTARGFAGASTGVPILIEQGEGTTAGTCYTLVDDITVENVSPVNTIINPLLHLGGTTTNTLGSVLVRNVHKTINEAVDVIRLQTIAGGTIRKVTVDGITLPVTSSTTGVVNLTTGGACDTLALAHVDVGLGTNARLVSLTGQLTTLFLDDIRVAGASAPYFVYCAGSQTALKIVARAVKLTGYASSYPWWLTGTVVLDMFGVDVGTCFQGIHMASATTTVRVRGAGIDIANTSSHPADGTAGSLCYSSTFDYKTDLSQVTTGKVVGDICWNTNAALACGVGQVICTGTGTAPNWKNLITGATY